MAKSNSMKYIKKPVALFLFLFFAEVASAQSTKVDSALQVIYTQADDSSRMEALSAYFRNIFYYESSREAKAALPYGKRMLEEALQSHDPYRIAKAHQSLAFLYYPMRDYPSSLLYANAAEKEWELSKNYRGLAEMKYVESALHLNTNELEKAKQLSSEALVICREHKLDNLYMSIANFSASLYSRTGDHEQAVAMYKELLKMPGLDMDTKIFALTDIGVSLKNLKRFDEAAIAYDSAMNLAVKNNLKGYFGAIVSNKAHLAFAENKFDRSEQLAKEALVYHLADNIPAWQLDIYELLRKIYEKKNDYKQALLYADKYLTLHDTLNDREKLSEYRELETKYNMEVKDRTIAEQEKQKVVRNYIYSGLGVVVVFLIVLLIQRNKIASERRKMALEHQRMRISRDLHDDLGSGLTGVLMLSEQLQNHSTKELVNSNIEKIKQSSRQMVEQMGEIVWAMNSKNDTLENLLAYLDTYTRDYFENTNISQQVSLPDTVPHIVMSGITRRNIFLVLKESLNNITKHACATEVMLDIKITENSMNIVLTDNGKGFEPGQTRRFGNGLKNMQSRMTDIKGSFSIESNNGEGTKTVISFPFA